MGLLALWQSPEFQVERPQRHGPSGGVVRPRRVVRFARLIHRRGRAFWRTFVPRFLRRQSSQP
jgi:hypothetical protein